MTVVEMQMHFGVTFLGMHTGKSSMSVLLGFCSWCCDWMLGQPVWYLGMMGRS